MSRRVLTVVVKGAVLVAVAALIAGQLLGQPVLLGFVETGSMEPTIETGDGFVAVPSALAGEPEPGDVIVFEAEELHGGGLTTHRVVEETDEGYVTKGDANPFTDQDGEEPPVQDGQIVAHAWRVDGEVVTIPSLGTGVMAIGDGLERVQNRLAVAFGVGSFRDTAGVAYLGLGLSVLLYGVETIRERRESSFESRLGRGGSEGLDPRLLSATFAALVVLAAMGAMLVPAGTHSYDVVSAESDSERPLVIERGTTEEIAYPVGNGGLVPIVSYVESGSDRAAVASDRTTVGPRDDGEVAVSITAPEETGHYPTYVTEYRYLRVLPLPVIDALYEVHPWAPFAAIVSLLGGGTDGLGRLLLRSRAPRARRAAARDRCTKTRSFGSLIRRLY